MALQTRWLYLVLSFLLTACTKPVDNSQQVYAQPPLNKRISLPVQQMENNQLTDTHYIPKPPLLKTKNKGLIVLDAGHGGKDLGTHSAKPYFYQEKSLTLFTAFILRNYLQQMGYDVLMTRDEDVFVALDKRAEFANNKAPRLFVSIHYNSAPNKEAEGIEIYYYRSDDNKQRTTDSKQLASVVLKSMLINSSAKSRGVKHGNFAVIRETKMPAILVEGGFLTNEQEGDKLRNGIYLKRLAWGIAQGVQNYMKRDVLLLPNQTASSSFARSESSKLEAR